MVTTLPRVSQFHDSHYSTNSIAVTGTWVHPTIYSVLFDERYYPNPSEFRPERFIDERNGRTATNRAFRCIFIVIRTGQLRITEHFVPFSLGRRLCMGESLAKMELFLLFANVMSHYEVRAAPDQPTPSLVPDYGLSAAPKPYKCTLIRRGKS